MNATTTRSLSANESKIVLDLEWREQKILTLAELRTMLGASDAYARYMASQLVRKGWFERLRPGLFRLIPADRGREGVADSNPLAAGAVLVQPYFFSFGTACTYHGLTEQVFAEIYIACQRPRRSEVVRGTRYVYVSMQPERFFGFTEVAVLGEKVQMATAERALLDALDRPACAGGLGEVSRMAGRASGRFSWEAMLALLERWNESALVQRLGYLLELHQVEVASSHRSALLDLMHPACKVHLGPRRRWGTSGRLARPWNVIENVPRDVLVDRGEHRRRRVSFTRREVARDR